MLKKILLSIIVLVVAYAVGIGISYMIKSSRDRDRAANSPNAGNQANQPAPTDASVSEPQPHTYSIQSLRNRDYSAGEIKIEKDLGDQGLFRSYVISYLSDGFKLNALMNVPDGTRPEGGFPVIVLNHGYIDPAVYDTITSYKSYMDAYSKQGFLVVKPDYRGHDDSEGEPVSAHTSPDYTIDVLHLIDALEKYPDANPGKIGMWGHSMGGGITLRAMVVSKDIKAVALLAGVVASPQSFYNYWQLFKDNPRVPAWIKENADRTLLEFGTPQQNPDLWNSISPYNYFAGLNIPVQIHHGTADTDVPIVFSEELSNALKDAGQKVDYFVYQNGDHNLAGAARSLVLSRTIEFFKTNLQ